jgi:hypothetical protein
MRRLSETKSMGTIIKHSFLNAVRLDGAESEALTNIRLAFRLSGIWKRLEILLNAEEQDLKSKERG